MPDTSGSGFYRQLVAHPDEPLTNADAERLINLMAEYEDKMRETLEQVGTMVRVAIDESIANRLPSEEEQTYLRLATQRAAQSVKLRQKIIENSLTGLVWGSLAGAAIIFKEWLAQHGFKL